MGRKNPKSIGWRKRKAQRRFEPSLRALRQASARSAITNGSRLLVGVDGRSGWSRRLYDLLASYTSDLGGDARLSEAERAIIRRASMLTLQLEIMEARFAQNEDGAAGPKQLLAYTRTVGTLSRLLSTIGLKRRARDVTPTLDQYLEQKRNGRMEAAE